MRGCSLLILITAVEWEQLRACGLKGKKRLWPSCNLMSRLWFFELTLSCG